MKSFLRFIVYKLIQLVECIQYSNRKNKDENNLFHKFVDIVFPKNYYVKTDYGYVPFSEINLTIPMQVYELELENGLKMRCADSHIIYCMNHKPQFVSDLTKYDYVITKYGLSRVKKISKLKSKISMFDLSVDTNEHSYYANDILSHNTISAAITLLWYALFFNEKNIVIVANSNDTIKEIIEKVKGIYLLLPFFLKKGVKNWNEKTISFDNKSRIKAVSTSKASGVGLNVDILYFDEFAKVEDKLLRKFYRSLVPTISSIKNSKIIITSTPDGFNLFKDLYVDSNREKGDPMKNQYKSLTIYWWQIAGRRDTKLFPMDFRFEKYGLNIDEFINWLKDEMKYNIYTETVDCIDYTKIIFDKDDDKTKIEFIRSLRYKQIPISELCIVNNWQEEQTVLIGGESAFKQEFDLKFVTDEKSLFDNTTIEEITKKCTEFEYLQIPLLDKKLNLPYENLKWIKDESLFRIQDIKKYYFVFSVDISEGLGKDYSIINIMRLMPKDKVTIDKLKHKFKDTYDYFKLEQVGIFRSSVWSITELATIFYLLVYELCDPDKIKVVVEFNKYGGEFLKDLPRVFNDNNEYSDHVFFRYKHNKNDTKSKKGLVVSHGEGDASKKILIKAFQDAINIYSINIHHDVTAYEITTFVKVDTPGGGFTYKGCGGNDDCVMTIVNTGSVFKHVDYKNLIDTLMKELPADIKAAILVQEDAKDAGVVDMSKVYNKLRNGSANKINNKFSKVPNGFRYPVKNYNH